MPAFRTLSSASRCDDLSPPTVRFEAPPARAPWPRRLIRLGSGACALLLAAGLAGGPSPVSAASPSVAIQVLAVPTLVTYSRGGASPLATYAAYQISVVNNSTNVINDVRFDAGATVLTPGETATFKESIGAGCGATNAAATAISCALGQLRGGGGRSDFVLIFNAPIAAAAPLAGDRIDLNWTVAYGEGPNDSGGASHTDTQSGLQSTLLGTPIATEVLSYVPTAGATLFTGVSGVATAGDPWTTTVRVPVAVRAELIEAIVPDSCSPDYLLCVSSKLTIPGSFVASKLLITLRRDVTTIRNGAKIENATLTYYPDDGGPPSDISACQAGQPNATVKRCISHRKVYTKKNSPSADYEGDWEFGIDATENGRIFW
jgi:hypothetical protein